MQHETNDRHLIGFRAPPLISKRRVMTSEVID
jgi:hypothetical protein